MFLEAILDTALDAIVVMRDDGTIAAWSRIAERIFGWSAAEAKGQSLSELIIPRSLRRRHQNGVNRFNRTGEIALLGRRVELTAMRRNGEEFPIELAVMVTARFEEKLFLGFIRDITDRKTAQQEIARLQAEMIRINRVSAMGTLAATLAHELNQPLTAITTYLGACQRAIEQGMADLPELAQSIDAAKDNAWRAGEIIRRMRRMMVRGDTEKRIVDASEVLEEAGELALADAQQKGIETKMLHSPGLLVRADPIQLQQVVLNLIRNAVEAMEGCPRRQLQATAYRKDDEVCIRVSDTGPGLSDAARETLFQPFITTKKYGMGVGLSISRTIVEAHHGRLWAEDREGGGTSFCIGLKAA
ncbi:MAG: domain S-box protein [Alphaproteobacteria bacterium]|nr:domain S-box protein [Alphaproteobacteria bacterium]